ncbi:MAG: hypothetical protein IKW76_04720 [Clostridia bacterium]|nr:hypothetical protein [Clostridia bacterium]
MLGKLIKHELKSTAHSMFGVYLAAAITFLSATVVLFLNSHALKVVGAVAMVLITLAVLIITLLCIFSMFNKSLYGAQGYLSFTLPVTGKQLLAAKTIVAEIWTTLSFVFVGVVYVYLGIYISSIVSDSTKQALSAAYDLLQSFKSLPDAKSMLKLIIAFAFLLFIHSLCIYFRVAFSVTVANTKTFQKYNPLLIGILIWAVLLFITYAILGISLLIPVGIACDASGLKIVAGDAFYAFDNSTVPAMPVVVGIVFEILECGMLYVATGNIMTNRVNIK